MGDPDRTDCAVQVVRGQPRPEELAAVIAALAARPTEGTAPTPTGYAAWRRTRLAALR